MNTATLRKINHDMSKFHHNERKLIARIDVRAKSNQAEENIMEKHYVGENHNGERTWRF